jgi:hypothetical protein
MAGQRLAGPVPREEPVGIGDARGRNVVLVVPAPFELR